MAPKVALPLALCLAVVLLPLASLAERNLRRSSSDQCRLDQLEAMEPSIRLESEAGLSEWWDHNHDQFQCAGVATSRHTLEPRGLLLPVYSNSPRLVYVLEGNGIGGLVIPGCPESFSSIQESSQSRTHGRGESTRKIREGERGGRSQEDQHQRIVNIRRGDVVAIPAGVPFWSYNNGDQPLVFVVLDDVANYANQLDSNPRRFILGGSKPSESGRQQSRRGTHSRGSSSQELHESISNIFNGFDDDFLAEALNIDRETARKLQSQAQEKKGYMVRVEGGLQVVAPRSSSSSSSRSSERSRGRGSGNGIEETLCNIRFHENIDDYQKFDVYSKEGGHLTTLNSYKLPVLWYLQLSAERGHLQRNAFVAPHWHVNSHSVMYAIKGSARVQIVDSRGNSVFDGELRQGQVLVVPQNFAVIKQAREEDFVWISFRTNDNAIVNQIAGMGSTLSGLPVDVLANSFQISREEAWRLKESRSEEMAILPARSAGSSVRRRGME